MNEAAPIPAPRYPAKIAAAADALARIAALPRPLVFTNGVFDVLHRGHVTCLDQARSLGASLVVAGLAAVDLVVPFDADTPRELIVGCMPDVLAKGGDYTAEATAGAAEVVAAGGRFVAIPFESAHSTTALVKRIREREAAGGTGGAQ